MATQDFDAIVIGSGITGGWAAKELSEKGLKTLLLDRGRMVTHREDYVTEGHGSFDLPYRGNWPPEARRDERFSHNSPVVGPANYHFFNDDRKNPYIRAEDKPYNWIRADIFGGRSIVWGRQCYRWSEIDFEANKNDGHGIDWPIRYADIAPWYSYVEKFVGISGEKLGLRQLPDGEFLPPIDLNIAEKQFKRAVAERFDGRVVTIGRTANLTGTLPGQARGKCMYRAQCDRGCSFGAYFSTQSSTLPAAMATGNVSIMSDTLVESLEFDANAGRITGVRVIDANTGARSVHRSRVVFLCASAIASTQILMHSKSESAPNGIGNNHDKLGRYLMEHTFGTGANGIVPGLTEYMEYGRRPTGMYVPRFRNLDGREAGVNFDRGYNYQTWGEGRLPPSDHSGFGAELKQRLRVPGPWRIRLAAFCEILPHRENRMLLDEKKPDRFGIPQVKFECVFRENEINMLADATDQAVQMLKATGCTNIETSPTPYPPGTGIHEMGGARMGDDPRESVVNRWNQLHDANNLFLTDGAAMTSASCVNPSVTYMALTARAADHAVELLKANQL